MTTCEPKRTTSSSRYIPALDGLRAFAVLSVLFYHMGMGWAPGGLMGVTVFFVISGYLINGLLVAEYDRTGSISLKHFWLRRVRRLFPAIALAVAGTAALCTLSNHVLLDKMRADIVPSLLFYNNWWQIFRDISYFEMAGSPSPLTHFWSLSIEEQFYVVWPLLLVVLLRIGVNKRAIAGMAAILAVASAIEMGVMYDPHSDPSRIYYGTDTRAMSLLLGVWLSLVWPSAAFGAKIGTSRIARFDSIVLNVVGVLALAGLVVVVGFTNGFSSFPYLGGVAFTSVLSALLIAVLVVPGTWVARFFQLPPLVWIGKISYGMYLWHFPVILLTTDPNATMGVPWWMRVVQVAATIGLAALSYYFVEDPIRSGKVAQWWRGEARGFSNTRVGVTAACMAAVLSLGAVGALVVAPTDYAARYAGAGGEGEQASSGETRRGDASTANEAVHDGGGTNRSASGQEDAKRASVSAADYGGASASAVDAQSAPASADAAYDAIFNTPHTNSAGQPLYEPLLIGDSVAEGATDEFNRVFPYGHIDAVTSRNIWESPYPQYAEADQVGDYVVICLGTNNAVVDWQIDDELLHVVPETKKVFMVNTRNDAEWLESTNAEINRTPERHPNVTVIDWFGASEGHDEYFVGDGTHLTEEGQRAYIALIQDALRSSLE